MANIIHEAAFRKLYDERAIRRTNPVLRTAIALHRTGSAGTRSGLEDRFLKLIRGAGLPEPIINTRHLGFELDFRWPGLNVEVDGDHHDRPRNRRDDRVQDAMMRANGFTVIRFREALAGGLDSREATGVAMETAGKAVFTSGLAVVAALMAVALVPSPTFQTVPLGIALSVCFVLAASLTLLPAVLSKLGLRVNRLPIPRLAQGSLRGRSEGYTRWGERVWRRPFLYGAGAVVVDRAGSSGGGVSRTRHGGVALGSTFALRGGRWRGSRRDDAHRRRGHFRRRRASGPTVARGA